MKILKKIGMVIFELILSIDIVVLIYLGILNNTILNKNYIFEKLEKTNYYSEVYNIVEDNFEKYIDQSGLDESVINNIVSEEKIKSDTKIIIDNIFEGKNEEISCNEIKQVLKKNILNTFQNQNLPNENAIEEFAQKIADEYSTDILNNKYISSINEKFIQMQKYISKIKICSIVILIISILVIFLVNIKSLNECLTAIEISGLASGILLIFSNIFINTKINIQSILILNNAFSIVFRNILLSILNSIKNYGIILVITFLLITIIDSIIKNNKKEK